MNTVFQRCVNYALKKVCFHNTPWCVNLHTPKTHLIVCYFKDKRCVWRTHHGVFWEHTCFYSACAKQAGLSDDEEERKNGLEEAYAIDWFTCHFLTDSFASGHMRYKHALQFGLLLKLKLLILKASLDREDNSFISFPKE